MIYIHLIAEELEGVRIGSHSTGQDALCIEKKIQLHRVIFDSDFWYIIAQFLSVQVCGLQNFFFFFLGVSFSIWDCHQTGLQFA